ncbi:MAG: DNA methyltransferase [bacterium]
MAVTTQLIDLDQIIINKSYSRISKIHKYWSRKPWYIIDQYINKYSKKEETVLDPFMGSGSTGLEAILNGRSFIGYDLNPISVTVSKNTLKVEFDVSEFSRGFKKIEKDLKDKIMDLYRIDSDKYILYGITGSKNTKDYNAVLGDYNFKNKERTTISKSLLRKEVPLSDVKYPDCDFPIKFYKDRFSYKGVKRVSQMFSTRNLFALAILKNYLDKTSLKYKDLYLLGFSNTILHASKLKGENVRPLSVNNYWIPDDYIEENVWWRFADRVNNIKLAKTAISSRITSEKLNPNDSYKLINKTSLKLKEIEDNSMDYIFTDPPYGDAIQYSELSYIWNCWLGKKFDTSAEVIINPVQNKNSQTFSDQMSVFLSNAHRVLKDNHYFTICFQNKNLKIWSDLAKIIRNQGFELVDISVYDTLGCPYNKNWSKFSPKSDFYITFRKIKQKSVKISKDTISIDEIFSEVLKEINGSGLDINKAYDLFVTSLMKHTFSFKEVTGVDKINLKSVISKFESYK